MFVDRLNHAGKKHESRPDSPPLFSKSLSRYADRCRQSSTCGTTRRASGRSDFPTRAGSEHGQEPLTSPARKTNPAWGRSRWVWSRIGWSVSDCEGSHLPTLNHRVLRRFLTREATGTEPRESTSALSRVTTTGCEQTSQMVAIVLRENG